jgi:hypothetical protein
LLRQVFEQCETYDAAKRLLRDTPICMPAFFTLAGAAEGEGCIIERTRDRAAIREMPAAIANDWIAVPMRGHARSASSRPRQQMMESALDLDRDIDWQAPPILNKDTRLVAIMNPSRGRLSAQGFERNGPVTGRFVLGASRERPDDTWTGI